MRPKAETPGIAAKKILPTPKGWGKVIVNRLAALTLTALCLLSAVAARSQESPEFPGKFELTLVDADATGYATFQSHNQKVLENGAGIFMTHIRTRNEAYTAQQWRLSRSADGGKSFQTIREETNATNPPVIETDGENNVYLIRPDFVDGNAYLYRFLAAENFASPHISRIPGASAGKYAMAFDAARKKLNFFAHNQTFHTLALDGTVERSIQLLAPGPDAALQYPLLALDAEGALHAAWTTQKNGVYLYWDIHCMRSSDGGATWFNLGGEPLAPPIVADQHGPAARLTLDDEFESHTWLSSFLPKGGAVHFAYLAQMQPQRQHYIRLNARNGRREIDLYPEFRGEKISLAGLDGFFASASRDAEGPLYFVGHAGGKLGALQSEDNGATWKDFALGGEAFSLYSIGGFRSLAPDGAVIGSFTDSAGTDSGKPSRVFFFKLRKK